MRHTPLVLQVGTLTKMGTKTKSFVVNQPMINYIKACGNFALLLSILLETLKNYKDDFFYIDYHFFSIERDVFLIWQGNSIYYVFYLYKNNILFSLIRILFSLLCKKFSDFFNMTPNFDGDDDAFWISSTRRNTDKSYIKYLMSLFVFMAEYKTTINKYIKREREKKKKKKKIFFII